MAEDRKQRRQDGGTGNNQTKALLDEAETPYSRDNVTGHLWRCAAALRSAPRRSSAAAGDRHPAAPRNSTSESTRQRRQGAVPAVAPLSGRTHLSVLGKLRASSAWQEGTAFRPLRGKLTGAGITAYGIYTVVAAYAKTVGIEVNSLGGMDSEQP